MYSKFDINQPTQYKDLHPTQYKDLQPTQYKDLHPTQYKDLHPTMFANFINLFGAWNTLICMDEEEEEEPWTRKICVKGRGTFTKKDIYEHLTDAHFGTIVGIELYNNKNNNYYSSYCNEPQSDVGFTAFVYIKEKTDKKKTLYNLLEVQNDTINLYYYWDTYWYIRKYVSDEQINDPLPVSKNPEGEKWRHECKLKELEGGSINSDVNPKRIRIIGSWDTYPHVKV